MGVSESLLLAIGGDHEVSNTYLSSTNWHVVLCTVAGMRADGQHVDPDTSKLL